MKDKFDFVYAGPQRTASSWLREVLIKHPEIHLPKEVKETYTFSSREGGHNDVNIRAIGSGDRVRGEFCTSYFIDEIAIRRIKSHNPQCKIIIGVREPAEKAWSFFQHKYALGEVPMEFFKACYIRPEIIFSGHYKFWIPLWENIFGEENVFLFDYHKLQQAPDKTLHDLASFLQISFDDLHFNIHQRVGEAVMPSNKWVSSVVSNTAQFLRNRNWHWLANTGKQLGFKNLAGHEKKIKPDGQITSYLQEIYREDIQYLKTKGVRDVL